MESVEGQAVAWETRQNSILAARHLSKLWGRVSVQGTRPSN